MYHGKTVGVVIPAYNERDHIGRVIDTLPKYVDRAYVINDGSTDDTWEVVQRHARRRNQLQPTSDTVATDGGLQLEQWFSDVVVPINHAQNAGVGAAIKTGYRHALEDGVDVTVVVGGDGQMRPDDIQRLITPIVAGDADYAKGNRLLERDSYRDMPQFRFVGNAILTFLTKVASGYWKTVDPQNGFTAISRDALEAIDIEQMYEDYGYCNDLLVRLNVAKLRVADISIPAVYADEKSHIRYSKYIPRVSLRLLQDFLWRLKTVYLIKDFNPLVSLYLLGTLLTFVGMLGGLWVVVDTTLTGGAVVEPALMALLVWGLGAVTLTLAMVYDMEANEGLEIQVR
jgi:glycosyltransferase involved in cell wall biosynthesis